MNDLQDRLDQVLPIIRDGADAADENAKFPTESIAALRDAGLLGLTLPVEVGGLGGSPMDAAEALMQVSAVCGSTSMIYLMHISAAMVTAAAPPAEAGNLLNRMAAGTSLGTLAFSEKGSRSHFWAPVSKAERQGDGQVHIGADKSFVTSASEADIYVTSALAPEVETPLEPNLYIVERTAPGVSVSGRFDGLGLRGNDSAPVRLDVDVSNGARLGEEKAGFGLMMQVVLPWFSLGNSAVSLGLAQAALDAAIAHARGPVDQGWMQRGCPSNYRLSHAGDRWRRVLQASWSQSSVPRRSCRLRHGTHGRCSLRLRRSGAVRNGTLLSLCPFALNQL